MRRVGSGLWCPLKSGHPRRPEFSMTTASRWPKVARLNSRGRRLIGRGERHALPVQLIVTTTSRQHFSEAYTLARGH